MTAAHSFDHTQPDDTVQASGSSPPDPWRAYGENVAAGRQGPQTVMEPCKTQVFATR